MRNGKCGWILHSQHHTAYCIISSIVWHTETPKQKHLIHSTCFELMFLLSNHWFPVFGSIYFYVYDFRRLFLFVWCGKCWCVLASGDFRHCSIHLRMDFVLFFISIFFFGWNNSIFMAIVPNKNLVGELFLLLFRSSSPVWCAYC